MTQDASDNTTGSGPVPQPVDRFEVRRQRRQARREARTGRFGGAVIGGAVLIALGIIALLEDFAPLQFGHWGALFILIPAAAAFLAAWRGYEEAGGRLTARALNASVIGLALIGVTGIIFFDLNWELFGPVLIILVGLGLLAGAALPK
jgi:hypothetical protein